jgi:quercetin dioxygenase-like cupin family protein
MGTASKGELIRAGEGKTYPFGDGRITIKVRGDDTENKYDILEFTAPPGFEAPPHVHQRTEQAYYVLEGELEFKLNEQTVRGRAGDLVRVPTGVSHAVSNPTKVWAKGLEVRTPGGVEKMFEERAQAFPPGAPIDQERMDAIMRRYDMIPAAPHATTRK